MVERYEARGEHIIWDTKEHKFIAAVEAADALNEVARLRDLNPPYGRRGEDPDALGQDEIEAAAALTPSEPTEVRDE